MLVLQPGIALKSPALEACNLNRWTTREVPRGGFFQSYWCIYLGPWWVLSAVWAFTGFGQWGLLSSCGLPIVVAPLAPERRPWVHRLRWLQLMSSGAVRPGARAPRTQYLWLTGLVVLRHVGSSQVRDQTRVSCIGGQFLYHWATSEAPPRSDFNDRLKKEKTLAPLVCDVTSIAYSFQA